MVVTRGEIIRQLQMIYEQLGRASERYRLHRNDEELLSELEKIEKDLEEIQTALAMMMYSPEYA